MNKRIPKTKAKTEATAKRSRSKTSKRKASEKQPRPILPPRHTQGEIAAVAATLFISEQSVASAIYRAVELLDAAEEAHQTREALCTMLSQEPTSEARIDFLEGIKRITGQTRKDRAEDWFRRFWRWQRWSRGKQASPEVGSEAGVAHHPPQGGGESAKPQLTAKQRATARTMEEEQWTQLSETYWTPETLALTDALYHDWLRRGEPEARTKPGRPATADLLGINPDPDVFGGKPMPLPTFGRAKEGALSSSAAGADSPAPKKV